MNLELYNAAAFAKKVDVHPNGVRRIARRYQETGEPYRGVWYFVRLGKGDAAAKWYAYQGKLTPEQLQKLQETGEIRIVEG